MIKFFRTIRPNLISNIIMKAIFLFLLVPLFIMNCVGDKHNSNKNEVVEETVIEANQLRHVVLFKFKETSTTVDIQKVEEAFGELPSKISEIENYEWGTNNSPENLNKGFTHCFFLTFNSEKDRDAYLVHPAHLDFGNILGPHLEDVFVLDYWAK